jgi:hypothetical protein
MTSSIYDIYGMPKRGWRVIHEDKDCIMYRYKQDSDLQMLFPGDIKKIYENIGQIEQISYEHGKLTIWIRKWKKPKTEKYN